MAKFNEHYEIDFSYKGNLGGLGSVPNITSDWKYIVLNWEVTNLSLTEEQQKNILVIISNPVKQNEMYYYNDYSSRYLMFNITDENSGYWGFSFVNRNQNVTVDIDVQLYKMR